MKDCTIIGGGPAGLNAALVLGRARRTVMLVDNNEARNKITRESHGFITRDGVTPSEFRELAHQDLSKYHTIETMKDKVTEIVKSAESFTIKTAQGMEWQTRKVMLATGAKEKFPNVPSIREFYGKSLFNCPYCDGWELQDQPLALFGVVDYTIHMAEIVQNWSKDLVIFTNGDSVSDSQMERIKDMKIRVETSPVRFLNGENGILESVELEDGTVVERMGGFVTPELVQATDLGTSMGLELDEHGGHVCDEAGKTDIHGLFVAGEAACIYPSQNIISAASGATVAMAVNVELTHEGILGSERV